MEGSGGFAPSDFEKAFGERMVKVMQLKFFAIPAVGGEEMEAEVNGFLRGHRAVTVQRELVREGGAAFWALCVEFLDGSPLGGRGNRGAGKARVDYKEVLSAADFAIFSKLRDKRKEFADKEAVPVYAVCTNEQLAEMAKQRCDSLSALKEIDGFGEAKGEKYGRAFLDTIMSALGKENEASGQPD